MRTLTFNYATETAEWHPSAAAAEEACTKDDVSVILTPESAFYELALTLAGD